MPIRIYQKFISPAFPSSCRFQPTCSNYSLESIKQHGPFKGTYLAVRRILKCHPFHPGGFDPVPEEFTTNHKHLKIKRIEKN